MVAAEKAGQKKKKSTYSKFRVNDLVGDKVGNVLDLGVVVVGRGAHGRRTGFSGSGSREVAAN